jgi:enolase-phosphatase E1
LKTPIRGILLDIEGTTSSISFVYDVMFPFVREQLMQFLERNWNSATLNACLDRLALDIGHTDRQSWLGELSESESRSSNQQFQIQQAVHRLMDADAKVTGLKQLQGLIWESGFKSGQLIGHLFEEVGQSIHAWASQGIDVRIYSSGSIAAQQLFFGHSDAGNLLPQIRGHYDTTLGGKQSPESYQKIATDIELLPEQILFISDVVAELSAAKTAGMQTLLSIRPGNKPVPPDHGFTSVTDFRLISF